MDPTSLHDNEMCMEIPFRYKIVETFIGIYLDIHERYVWMSKMFDLKSGFEIILGSDKGSLVPGCLCLLNQISRN